jgi:hypothetical protein
MSFVAAAAIGAGGAIVGGYLSGQAAQRGAQAQADAMRESAALQKQMFDVQNAQQAPYREAGYSALSDISGMKPYLTQQFGPEQFAAGVDPSYAFRLQQGNLANLNLANQAGGAISGNTLTGLMNFGLCASSQEDQNAFNRYHTQRSNIYNNLASIAGLGQTSLGQTGQLSSNTAQGVGNAISGAGSAIGAGQVAMGNALGGGIQSAGNQYMLSQLLSQRNPVGNANYSLNTGIGSGVGLTQAGNNLDYMGGAQGLTLGGGLGFKT